MDSNIHNRKETSNEIIYNKNTENDIEYNKNNFTEENKNFSQAKGGNKLITFIKAKPLFFTLIVLGTTAVITTAITLPLVLINNEKKVSKVEETDFISFAPDFNDNTETDDNNHENNENSDDNNHENNENSNNNDELPNFSNIINIDKTKPVNLASIDISSQLTNIGSNSNTLDSFCTYLGEINSNLDSKKKVKLIYKWVCDNIEYDYENYKANNPVNCEPEGVLSNKKTVCSGYARLFTKLLKCLGYPENDIINIIGHSKGLGYDVEKPLTDEDTDHEWNAVKIEDKWCLIDTTWGAGSIVNDAFVKSYSEYYLCTPPAQFLRSHLPKQTENQYQFLENPIDLTTFKNLASTTLHFFEYGFVGLSNDKAIQNFCGEGKIILKYDTNIRPNLLLKIKKGDFEYNNWIMEEKIQSGYNINFYINEAGNYDLSISANDNEGGNSYIGIVSFKIKCHTTPSTKKYFPTLYSGYKNDESMKIMSPIDNNLIQGEKYNFQICTSHYDKLYLILGKESNNEFIEMNKEGINFFENDVLIHGNYAKISYKNSSDGKYYTLVEYSTQGEMIEFPSTSETPFKKRLESPLLSNLSNGETYNFKIICDTTYSIKIYFNARQYDLTKDDNIYTASIKIDAISSLFVMYGEGGSFTSMYTFTVS